MEAAAGHALDDAAVRLAAEVHRETDGNPFFVSEVLRHLAETGAISQDATGRWVADGAARADGVAAERARRDRRRVGRLGRDAERVLSLAAVIGRDFDLDLLAARQRTVRRRPARHPRRRHRRGPGARAHRHPRALQLRPRPHPTHPVRGSRPHPPGPGPPAGGRSARRPVRRPARVTRRRAGPPLVRRPPTRRPAPRPSTTPARPPTPPSPPSPPATPCATTPRPSTSTHSATHPDPMLGIDLRIGLGTAQRQTGDAAFRDTLLDAARRAADLGDTDRLVAAALANNRGMSPPSAPSTATRSRSWSWPSNGSPPTTRPGRSCSPPCAPSSPTAATSSVARPSPTRPSPSPEPSATTPPSCGSSTTSSGRSPCRSCSNSRWHRSAEALERAERAR